MYSLSSTLRSRRSTDTEESKESPVITEIQESIGTSTTQDMAGPSRTQISKILSDTLQEPDTETSMDAQSEGGQTDGESAPRNSQTGALVPAQYYSPLYYLWRILFFWSWFGSQASQTHEEEPGAAGNKDDVNTDDEEFAIHERPEASFKENIDKIREIILSSYSAIWWYFQGLHTVGIFSRSSESDYEWLINQLKSEPFHSTVSTVLPYTISNNGMWQFRDAVSRCTFGILYHSKKRGRLNIVDDANSVYDEELKYMSERLGKENVIVVVDDVEDTSNKKKTQILRDQPSIGNVAKDIFLFNEMK